MDETTYVPWVPRAAHHWWHPWERRLGLIVGIIACVAGLILTYIFYPGWSDQQNSGTVLASVVGQSVSTYGCSQFDPSLVDKYRSVPATCFSVAYRLQYPPNSGASVQTLNYDYGLTAPPPQPTVLSVFYNPKHPTRLSLVADGAIRLAL